MKEKEDDLGDVISQESQRGRRRVDIAERKRRSELKKKFAEIVRGGDEDQFRRALVHVLGQLPGSPQYERSVRAWREFHRKD